MLLTVVSALPVSKRCGGILAGFDGFEHADQSGQIVDVQCRGDVEVTWHQRHAVQHGGRGTRDDVVDAGVVESAD